MTEARSPWAVSFALSFALSCAVGCGAAQGDAVDEEPLGRMPSAVTTAEPQWLPFAIMAGDSVPDDPREPRLRELRRLPFEGEVSRAGWSPDGRKVVLEGVAKGTDCSQVYVLDLASGESRRVSPEPGAGRGGAFLDDRQIVFAGTSGACPDAPLSNLELLRVVLPDAHEPPRPPEPLFPSPAFDGPARTQLGAGAAAPGALVLFQSARDGDLELYVGDTARQSLTRITDAPGFDGEGDLSANGSRVVWSASRPRGAALDAYRRALDGQKLHPVPRELWIATVAGRDGRPLTKNGADNHAPAFFPDSRRVVFASTMSALAPGEDSALYVLDADGPAASGGFPIAERITAVSGDHGAPAVSPDGKYLLFTSTREPSAAAPLAARQLFVARWIEDVAP